jgi:hypothetical protein
MKPIELLEKELNELKRSLEKSNELYKNKAIDSDIHETHLTNLHPKIFEYEEAILKLKL